MIIFENKKVKLFYNSAVPCVVWKPLEYMRKEEFYEPFIIGMNFLEEKIKTNPELGWINDTRLLRTVRLDDIMWLNKNVNERAYKIGAKKVAFVVPNNVFGRIAVKMYIEITTKRSDNTLEIKAFHKYKFAVNWLRNLKNAEITETTI